jgi:hypothetical protein
MSERARLLFGTLPGGQASATLYRSFYVLNLIRPMVGDPKQLSDLAKVEADVRIVCRCFTFEDDWDLNALARRLRRIGGSTVWTEITRGMRCNRPGCKSTNLYALPVEYGQAKPNAPVALSPLDRAMIDLALTILRDATRRSKTGQVGTADVRLALYVVHGHLRDAKLVREFWIAATEPDRKPWSSCQLPMRWIEGRLARRGFVASR